MPDLSVVILTYNEEIHISRVLNNVRQFCTSVYIIDSYSTDKTIEIAKQFGATVLQNTFVNQSHQFRWALENANIKSEWIMRLDADEIVEADLVDEISVRLPRLGKEVAGVQLRRKHIFL